MHRDLDGAGTRLKPGPQHDFGNTVGILLDDTLPADSGITKTLGDRFVT